MLNKNIRCDRCGSEAWVIVKKDGSPSELSFCAHDYNAHSVMLHAEGWAIAQDERNLIDAKASNAAVA